MMECDGCDLVRYCSDKCQKEHRPQHETNCKERAAELRDEILFRQPESTHLGDCPICFLPLPLDLKNSMMSCCGKWICDGCACANKLREREARLRHKCLFCRSILPTTLEQAEIKYMKRAEANDPVAMTHIGKKHYHNGDYEGAFEYYTKAADLGDVIAHYSLSVMYQGGPGVEEDLEKEVYHLEEAAIAGHPDGRYNLASYEWDNERYDRAVKHFIIAANLGYDKAIQGLKECYKRGLVSKDDFAAALRAHQSAVDATKSPQREAAKDTIDHSFEW
eukprot:scaffold3651_cov128-Skeletonema_dohrnii-CCMP3373.AAC.2